ncbi:MAG TPA: hypothetical protein VFK30_03905 [Anaerolineae bacterium]|nr:hypothetical protein [Anaerolineae bacterium]
MNTDVQSKSVKPGHFRRVAVVKTSLLLAAFLIGYVPMWLKSRKAAGRLSEAERHLDAATVENALASAAVDTR